MKCPCEQCITYVMCRERVDVVDNVVVRVAPVARYCDPLLDYLFEEGVSGLQRLFHVRTIFQKKAKK